MSHSAGKMERLVRKLTIITLSFIVCWGLVLVIAQVKPFWVDEWRLIYNLKFKTHSDLWGPLDFTQQFPRVYLQVMKAFTSLFDYSYFIMRLPSFLVGTATIFLCYHLMCRIFTQRSVTRYLFVFILVSSYTFTEYFVQVKQYSMEIFLSLTAIWQLFELLDISKKGVGSGSRYALLCFSFLAAPFFSYTYPIAATPIYLIIFFSGIQLLKSGNNSDGKLQNLLLLWFPLIISACSIVVFYLIDVSHLMSDKEMNGYWSYRMISGGSGAKFVMQKLWDFFAQVGSGLIFEIIFGLIGIAAFVWGIYTNGINLYHEKHDTGKALRLYSILLIILSLLLFFCGKLPIEHKFNAYTVPSIAILIIFLIDWLLTISPAKKFTGWLTAVLIAGLVGNIITTAANPFLSPDYALRMNIYVATENAIMQAQARKLPIIVTPGVALPDSITITTRNLTSISASSVLKTFPAYKVKDNLKVYALNDLAELKDYMKKLPDYTTSVIAGDGTNFQVVTR